MYHFLLITDIIGGQRFKEEKEPLLTVIVFFVTFVMMLNVWRRAMYFLVTAETVGQNFHQLSSSLTVHYIEFQGFDC